MVCQEVRCESASERYGQLKSGWVVSKNISEKDNI